MISLIYSLEKTKENVVFVRAIVEDVVKVYEQSSEEPAEYGPAVCSATFTLSDDDVLPEYQEELIEFLENLDLEWTPITYDSP